MHVALNSHGHASASYPELLAVTVCRLQEELFPAARSATSESYKGSSSDGPHPEGAPSVGRHSAGSLGAVVHAERMRRARVRRLSGPLEDFRPEVR